MKFTDVLLKPCVDFGDFGIKVYFSFFDFILHLTLFNKVGALIFEIFNRVLITNLLTEHEHGSLTENLNFVSDNEEGVEYLIAHVFLGLILQLL